MTENPNQGRITVQIDRGATEQRLMDEKDAERKAKEEALRKLAEYEAKEQERLALEEQRAAEQKKPAKGVATPTANNSGFKSKFPAFNDYSEMGEYMAKNKDNPEVAQYYDALTAKALNEFSNGNGKERLELSSPLASYGQGKIQFKVVPNTVSNDEIDTQIESGWKS
jgi:hypothetical protein